MKFRRDYYFRYRLRSALAVGLFAAGLFAAVGNATWAQRYELTEPSQGNHHDDQGKAVRRLEGSGPETKLLPWVVGCGESVGDSPRTAI